ncbi:MAG: hypothetical protein JKY61_04405 [Planctomycetes bacterium]|nr:hypothetical protein [Planctomycetota bacterium]
MSSTNRPPQEARPAYMRLFLTFLPMACVGTLLHEGGHIAVARALGYSTTLHFGSMSWFLEEDTSGARWNEQHSFWISVGGPLMNMGLGVIGLVWLAKLAKRGPIELRGQGLAAVLLALFWSRQVFNLALLGRQLLSESDGPMSDEIKIALYLDWPIYSVSILTALVAAMAVIRTILHVKRTQRLALVVSGALGSLTGFALWYMGIGPLILP